MRRPPQVDPSYRHYAKLATPRTPLTLGGARLKWYDIARQEAPVSAGVNQIARDFLVNEARSDRWELGHELGFVLLHLCGEDFYFLIVNTWRGSNELWETVYFKQNANTPEFSLFPREQSHKGTYCVWEMGPMWHEKCAWVRFLHSNRSDAAQNAYLNDQFSGLV